MTDCRVRITHTDGTEEELLSVLSFIFTKDVYTPYTQLTLTYVDWKDNIPEDILEVKLVMWSTIIHHGPIDSYKVVTEHGRKKGIITSRGFTAALIENQIEPKMYIDISLNRLFDEYVMLPYIQHENNSETDYIYVKKNTPIWDAAVALAYKRTGKYPYIRDANTVMMNMPEDTVKKSYTDDLVITYGTEIMPRHLISHYHMADLDGTYGKYDYEEQEAVDRRIVRHRYFELDRRFLNDPMKACEFRTAYAKRGFKRRFFRYGGYKFEDLNDIVTYNDIVEEHIKALKIVGNTKGVFTEISIYEDDGFSQ
ncbi:MAG: hypothetical protein K2J26_01580 [Ruminococcus sp.]|nr:hypothetical protein [Ruminococcus sp.]